MVKYVNDLLDRSGLHEMYIRTLKDPTDNIPYSEEEYGLDGAQILDLAVFLCMTFTIQTGHIIPDCVEMIKNVLCDPEEGFIYNYF